MKIIVKSVQTKSGEKDGKLWELFIVTSMKGTEYVTFDTKVRNLGEGSEIEIGEPEEVKKGKYTSYKFDSVEVLKEIKAGVTGEGRKEPGNYKRDIEGIAFEYELKASMQAIERASIEGQTAYIKVMELASTGLDDAEFKKLFKKALQWAEAKLDESIEKVTPKPVTKPTMKATAKSADKPAVVTGTGQVVDPEYPFLHIGALLKWWTDNSGTRKTFMEVLKIKEADFPQVNLAEAHQVLKDYLKEHPKDKSTNPDDPEKLFS